jgi:glucosyl-dolichyl phosphate glucuronosyltransferase
MRLEIVLPTFNRSNLLRLTLKSLADAPVPPGLDVSVLVIDNRSTDDTASVVAEAAPALNGKLRRVVEERQGKVFCLNTGLSLSNADLIGLIDDDEQIHPGWFRCIHSAFQDETVDFIGGRCLPAENVPLPVWVPQDFLTVVGWADSGDSPRQFGTPDFNAMMMGGNAVVRRSAFARVGSYSTQVNRTHKRLISGEDEDMYKRLIAAGCRGFYRPDLIIYHHVFPERLKKSYFRRWAFWQGVSLSRQTGPRPACPHLLGIPRWAFREGILGLFWSIAAPLQRRPDVAFSGRLRFLRLLGRLYGQVGKKA